jgi:hypothetical protein
MPQVILFAALGGAIYAGYRAVMRASEAIAADLRRTEDAARERAKSVGNPDAARDLGTLEFDPNSGVYKPTRKD